MSAAPVWLATIEMMLNRALHESPDALRTAAFLQHRSMAIEIPALVRIHMTVQQGRLFLSTERENAADATISGSVQALLALHSAQAPHPKRGAAAQVRGDAEVASRFRELLKILQPDPEFELARLIGDVPAHGAAKLFRGLFQWTQRTASTARANVREYLQEESRDLVNPTELQEFVQGVDQLRELADRVEARLTRLERRGGSA